MGKLVKRYSRTFNARLWVILPLIAVLAVACGAAEEPASEAPAAPTATFAAQTIPQATEAPPPAASAKNSATVVTEAEPASIGAWSEGCSAEIHSMGCQDFVTDFLTWLDDRTSEIVPLSGVVDWEQIDVDRWQFNLRDGVKFHNGAPWNAAAAKYGIEYNGFPDNPSASVTWTGPDMTAEVIDDLTVHAVCPNPCPIYPRTALFADFQDPEWF